MSAEAFYDAARALKRELTDDAAIGLTQGEVAQLQAVIGTWVPGTITNLTALSDAGAFFASVRSAFGGVAQPQVDGFQALLQAFGTARWPVSWAAYGLATAFHETNKTMQPVQEAYWLSDSAASAYFFKMYDPEGSRPDVAKRLGNTQPGDGARFCGRGYVQLTGRTNYNKAAQATGADLIAHPELTLKADIAAKIMVWGMSEGTFTSRKLADFLPPTGVAGFGAYTSARRIINGQDRAADIAKEAQQFEAALLAGRWA